jgi:hypothetical protein
MPRYVIERNLPGAGKLSPKEIRAVAQKSCNVLAELGSGIQWMGIYCVYLAPDEEMIREHARRGGFPADRISRVSRKISPLTAEAEAQPGSQEP